MIGNSFLRQFFGGCAALVGALVAIHLQIPLPWLLGPLFAVAMLRLGSVPIASSKILRFSGQWVIGTSLGLYFTPVILDLVFKHWFVIIVGMLIPLVLSVFGTWVLWRVGRTSLKTAWFSAAIGGASEMSHLAERYGGRVDLVASAHSLRILAVVIVIPFGFQYWKISGGTSDLVVEAVFSATDLSLLILGTTAAGWLFQKRDLPNAWVLGPLLVSIILTLSGIVMTSMPSEVVNVGQLLIGWSLGDRYRPAFFKAAPRFLLATFIFIFGSLIIVALLGSLMALYSELPLATIWLGLAPGGLAEMAITAKVLMLGVPMVTALQVTRMVFVVVITGWLYNRVIMPIEKKLSNPPD
jgi:uncharacterized protein